MLEILFHLCIGMLIGWHIPQPIWVTTFFDSELWAKIKVSLHLPTK